ncbi:MAG: caspase family protein [Saprospiraceae bacterium]|nr:caspase family protein [Saprospiraceae bacterium]
MILIKTKTLATLDKMNPKSNDIVLFIYRGHGFRWSDQSEPWPQMDLRNGNYGRISQSTSVGLTQVFNIIRSKNARLNIVLADCCNNDIGINRKTETPLDDLESKGSYDADKLKKLFLESKGSIISCAASPGEYSWVNTTKGGFYTLSFIESLRAEVSSKNRNEASWESVLNNTIDGAKKKTEKCSECTAQTGKFYSSVKG